jgi:SAM-dependent methyltransferase
VIRGGDLSVPAPEILPPRLAANRLAPRQAAPTGPGSVTRMRSASGSTDIRRLPSYTEQFDELLRWIDESMGPDPVSVLDVGGGGGFYDFPAEVRGRARRMVGVDPDAGVLVRPWLDEGHQELVEEYAAHAGERFELALCVYVVEHVEQPTAFFAAIRSLLEDGGACVGVTPNLWHYFGLASAVAARVGLEDRILHLVRPHELIEAYHSPVRYRCNTVRKLRATALSAGFRQVDFRVLEQPAMFETYFPASLRWWPRGYGKLVNRWAPPALFGTLLFRMWA